MTSFTDVAYQAFFGVVVLGACIWFGYVRWVKPHDDQLDARGRVTLVLVLLTLFGGGLGAFGWFLDDPRSFSWDLPPLASRMLAAAGWAFAALCYLAVRRPAWPRVSLALLALAVYLVPIGLAALIFHSNRFDFGAPITYAFFLVVISMSVAAVWFLTRPSPSLQEWDEPSADVTVSPLGRAVLLVTSATALPWSMALFLTDDGPSRLVWVWPGDLLSSRLIAVMLLTIGVTSFASTQSISQARLTLVFNLVYGVGVVAAGLANAWFARPIPMGYVVAFGLIALASAVAIPRVTGRTAEAAHR